MKNVQALEMKIQGLKEKWEQIAFSSEFKGEMKFEVLGTIESEIYLSKQALEKMKKTINETEKGK